MDAIGGGGDIKRLPETPRSGQAKAGSGDFGAEIKRLMESANEEFDKPNRTSALGNMSGALHLARSSHNEMLLRQTWQSVANIVTGQKPQDTGDPSPSPSPSPSPKGGDPNPKGGDPNPKG